MAINYRKLRNVTAREIISALVRDGFAFDRQSGSHQHYRHPDGRRVTVSFHHAGQTFPLKTLRRMVEDQAGWSETDLKRLNLVK
jgi:predicted RNA binding protein YcfA (HicA-like mRNA interferase family)